MILVIELGTTHTVVTLQMNLSRIDAFVLELVAIYRNYSTDGTSPRIR